MRLSYLDDDGFALVFQLAGGTTLSLTRIEAFRPQPFTVLDWNVDDLDATVRELGLRGVEFESYRHLRQDELEIWTAPGGSRSPGSRIPTATRCRSQHSG